MNFNAVNKLVKLHGVVGQRSFLLYYSLCKKKCNSHFLTSQTISNIITFIIIFISPNSVKFKIIWLLEK